jgi:GTP:adenosylcobinamide-phosphate guanylyltransferase
MTATPRARGSTRRPVSPGRKSALAPPGVNNWGARAEQTNTKGTTMPFSNLAVNTCQSLVELGKVCKTSGQSDWRGA